MRAKDETGGEHHPSAARPGPHELKSARMTADQMHRDAIGDLACAVVKLDAPLEQFSHHRRDVVGFKRVTQIGMAHAPAGAVFHFAVLNVIARVREQIVVAGVVPMHVRGDDVLDLGGFDADGFEAVADRMQNGAAALFRGPELSGGWMGSWRGHSITKQ